MRYGTVCLFLMHWSMPSLIFDDTFLVCDSRFKLSRELLKGGGVVEQTTSLLALVKHFLGKSTYVIAAYKKFNIR